MNAKQVQTDSADWNLIDEGAGVPLLLVHGFPLDHSMWRFQIQDLAQHARVIAPDLPGFGRSRNRKSPTPSLEGFADQLIELVDSLEIEEPVCFCGLSMGGYIGWQFWKNYRSRLQSLIVCDTRSLADAPLTARAREWMARQVTVNGVPGIIDGLIEKLFAKSTLTQRPELIAQVRQVIGGSDRHVVAASQRAMAARPDATPWLDEIKVPTLVVVGQHDVISTPEEMSAIADALADSRFVEIEGGGHLAPLENPTAFNLAVRKFLGNQEQAGTPESFGSV